MNALKLILASSLTLISIDYDFEEEIVLATNVNEIE